MLGQVCSRLHGMRGGVAMLAGAILFVALSGSAAARSMTIITLSVGDGLMISGSKIQCGVSANSGYGLRLSGKTYIVCGPSTQVKGGGYVALIESDGRVVILSVKTHKTVSSRAPQAVGRRSSLRTARLGDVIVLSGTSILCTVIKVGGKPTLICEYVDSKGVVHPNSYSFGISDAVVSSLRWDTAKQVHVLQTWPEG
jgi:hypothetical protein